MAGHIGAVAVDAGGAAVAPAGGWADDRGLESAAMAARCGPAGRPVPTGGGLALLRWPRSQSTTARWLLSPKDFLVHRLTGEAATDRTSAAYTMAFDVRRSGWAADLGADAAYFPPVHPATAVVGRVTTAAAERTGLPAGLPILAGGPDGTVGVAAVAGTGTGVIVDVAGTTDVIARLHAEPHTAPDAILNPYLVEGLWTVGGPTGMTGGAVAALAGLTGGDPGLADAGDLPAGSDGLLVLH